MKPRTKCKISILIGIAIMFIAQIWCRDSNLWFCIVSGVGGLFLLLAAWLDGPDPNKRVRKRKEKRYY